MFFTHSPPLRRRVPPLPLRPSIFAKSRRPYLNTAKAVSGCNDSENGVPFLAAVVGTGDGSRQPVLSMLKKGKRARIGSVSIRLAVKCLNIP